MIEITTLTELTIDGKLSLGAGGSSKALFDFYGPELRAWFHAQRAQHDAIMVGAGTVRCDDPELTVRYASGLDPLRVIPASLGDLPLHSRLLNDGRPTVVAVSRQATDDQVHALRRQPAVEVARCGDQRVDLHELLAVLEGRGIRSLLVEGGSRLLHSLFEAQLVARIIIKHLPVICGAADAPSLLPSGPGALPLPLSRWQLVDWFVMSGVAISVHCPLRPVA